MSFNKDEWKMNIKKHEEAFVTLSQIYIYFKFKVWDGKMQQFLFERVIKYCAQSHVKNKWKM